MCTNPLPPGALDQPRAARSGRPRSARADRARPDATAAPTHTGTAPPRARRAARGRTPPRSLRSRKRIVAALAAIGQRAEPVEPVRRRVAADLRPRPPRRLLRAPAQRSAVHPTEPPVAAPTVNRRPRPPPGRARTTTTCDQPNQAPRHLSPAGNRNPRSGCAAGECGGLTNPSGKPRRIRRADPGSPTHSMD